MNGQGYSKEDQYGAKVILRNKETDDIAGILYSGGGRFSEWRWLE